VKIVIVSLLAALALVGCDKKEEAPAAPPAKPEKTAEAPKPAATPAAAAPVEADDDLPTIADFEEDAEKEIHKDSVDSEVDKLAKEIGE